MTLIGATTENPYFQVNSALLSRSRSTRSSRSRRPELEVIVRRGAAELETERSDDARELIAQKAGGDARNALNILEIAARRPSSGPAAGRRHIEDASSKRPLVYDSAGEPALRLHLGVHQVDARQDADAAVYYLAAMIEAGEDPRFIARRMVMLRLRGHRQLADPRALHVAVAAATRSSTSGLPEAQLNLSQAAIYLAARRSRTQSSRAQSRRPRGRARARQRAPAEDRCAARATGGAKAAREAARATSTRTTTRAASSSTTCPRNCAGGATAAQGHRRGAEAKRGRIRLAGRRPGAHVRSPRLPEATRCRRARPRAEAVAPRADHHGLDTSDPR